MFNDDRKELRQEIQKVFEKFKLKDKPDFLSSNKLRFALRGLGFEPKKDEIKEIIAEFDQENEGVIAKDDFVKIAIRKSNEKDAKEEILKAFELFDTKQEGKISFEDLKRVSEELNENITDNELMEMIKEADLNNDNYVDKDEFLEIMRKTALY